MDPDASPEEIDFEGLNGRINVRQSQVRFMPRIGSAYELQFALEDPIQNFRMLRHQSISRHSVGRPLPAQATTACEIRNIAQANSREKH